MKIYYCYLFIHFSWLMNTYAFVIYTFHSDDMNTRAFIIYLFSHHEYTYFVVIHSFIRHECACICYLSIHTPWIHMPLLFIHSYVMNVYAFVIHSFIHHGYVRHFYLFIQSLWIRTYLLFNNFRHGYVCTSYSCILRHEYACLLILQMNDFFQPLGYSIWFAITLKSGMLLLIRVTLNSTCIFHSDFKRCNECHCLITLFFVHALLTNNADFKCCFI